MSDDELKPDIITCETCVRSVQQPYGTKRTVCPYCGHFYDSKQEEEIDESIVRLPRVASATAKKTKQVRRRFGIGKIFNNLRSRRGQAEESVSDEESTQLSTSSNQLSVSGPSAEITSGTISQSHSVENLLPPISSAEKTQAAQSTEVVVKVTKTPSFSLQTLPHRLPEATPIKPETIINSVAKLEEEMYKAKHSGNYSDIHSFYTTVFHSFQDLNVAFKKLPTPDSIPNNASHLNLELIQCTYDRLMELPQDLQKATLKSVINSLLSDQRSMDAVLNKPICKDDLRAYFTLSQNPQFKKPSTYVVYAHLLRQIATLCEQDQKTLADWFAELSKSPFCSVIQTVQKFITIRIFPPRPQELPPVSKCTWWVPCAVRVLAVLNVANSHANLTSFTDFYNESIDHWDLMQEYYAWETPTMNTSFSFCQYPFILSINAKRSILEGHAEQQMIATARDSILGNLACRRTPDMDMLFLTIAVRRKHLLADSLAELSKKQHSLRKKLRVQFAGEPGLDMGGLAKEWFQLLVRKIFHPDYGMFVYHEKSEVFWFSTTQSEESSQLREYHLIGILMGLAVYNGVILDIHFPQCCYKKLLSPPVVPRILDSNSSPLGVTPMDIDDLALIMPDTAHGLKQLLDYENNVEEDFGISFQISCEEFGGVTTFDLKENGATIAVNNENKAEFVSLYVDWVLNRSIYHQFKAFYLGFHSVVASNVMLLLTAQEIEMLVCGSPDFDMSELVKVTIYDGYTANDKTIKYFWELILKLPQKHQKRLLLFVTGSDRIPAGGMKEMTFKISKMVAANSKVDPTIMLPMAHTCFNQIVLPDYQDRRLLRRKLSIALGHGEGFGLE